MSFISEAFEDVRRTAFVYMVNDCEWICATSMREAVEFYLKEFVDDAPEMTVEQWAKIISGEDNDFDDYVCDPHEIIPAAMDTLKFVEEGQDVEDAVPFRTKLDRCLAKGMVPPFYFACTEY